ncbi:MalY/PatB family protein [Erwinia psidii]|uniref:cysteine-S-conjugate beta-lyase n=1 Tax=Erwinia psidii TaxID=69224 RepID=A0A3N6V2E0_9GAMM|nr:PatB family C-S lyase [Erwinia psidii]MCX8956244.1 putative C-S lyase [Erwinia psidii]MCX8959996.1 putative C-S lyase [Erwinia psidii]MCX8963541.1 putative C-S lyase [Erwinia psidii]RQM39245.1 putative C-S lyase [Erwinia psidii]
MICNFDQRIDRRHSDSLKWQKYGDSDILPLWVADTDFRSPDCINDALKKRIEHGIFGYGKPPVELAEVVVSRMAERYQWQTEPEWLVFLPGVVSGLNIAVRALTEAHEGTIAPTPIYPPFRSAARLANRSQLNAQMRLKEQRWVIDLNELEPQMTGNEKLLMLCNPHNPGGTVYRRDELEQQLRFAQRHNLIVCSDEIHCDLLLEPGVRHIPFASLSEDAQQRSVTLLSPSKTFNIAGLGASLAIIPDKGLRSRFNAVRQGIVPAVDILALTAATAAWQDGQPWLDQQLAYLRKNRDFVTQKVNAISGLSVVAPEASYLSWIDAGQLQVANPTLYFERHGLGFSPGADFGDNNFVRLNFGCQTDLLKEALRRMENAVRNLAYQHRS